MTNNQKEILILAGAPPLFGTGHLERMKSVAELLMLKKYRIMFVEVKTTNIDTIIADLQPLIKHAHKKTFALIVVDARDLTCEKFLMFADSVVALDNQSSKRESNSSGHLIFYDSLPHPSLSFEDSFKKILISPDLIRIKKDAPPFNEREKRAFVYAGAFPLTDMQKNEIRQIECEQGIHFKIIDNQTRVTRQNIFEELLRSKWVVTYYGMTLFEGWVAGAVPVLMYVSSPVHHKLAMHLMEHKDIMFWRSEKNMTAETQTKNLNSILKEAKPSDKLSPPPDDGILKFIAFLEESVNKG